MELLRAVNSHGGVVEAQNGAWMICGPVTADSQDGDEDPDPH
jgi:hypothetical protein